MTSGPVVWACLSCISYFAGGAAFWLPWSDPGAPGPGAPGPGAPGPCTTPLELFYGTGALKSPRRSVPRSGPPPGEATGLRAGPGPVAAAALRKDKRAGLERDGGQVPGRPS